MECRNCQGICIKKGCQNRRQKYFCKICKLYQQKTYTYKLCTKQDEESILKLNNIGVGISGIAVFTGMSKANVIKKIMQMATAIVKPVLREANQTYEMDEMHTYIGNKKNSSYIIYAINRATRCVVDFVAGSRTKENIGKVIDAVKSLTPKRIYTDKLNIYPGLIEKNIHATNSYTTNRIERLNLTLRTHLKRLSRKTICFSRSKIMLENCLKIYLWG